MPEFADLGALPATHCGVRTFGRSQMCATIFQGPAADLGAVELEGEQSQSFGGGETVWARRSASQALFEEVGDRIRPSGGVVATRGSRKPQTRLLAGVGAEVIGGECIEAAVGQAQLLGGLGGRQGLLAEGSQHMPDESRGVAMR